ncbi:MAG: putative glycoside hydrolase [Patescibacteria group bacterium]
MREFLRGFSIVFLLGAGVVGGFLFFPSRPFFGLFDGAGSAVVSFGGGEDAPAGKTVEERIAEAEAKSAKIKGIYMTADVASDEGSGATRLREHIIRIAEDTEINGIVIDVKEVCGVDYDEKRIRELLTELKRKNIWSIARITVFKDASQIHAHPDWYLARTSPHAVGGECARKRHLTAKAGGTPAPVVGGALWQDRRGGYWMDPAVQGVRRYMLDISKRMIDLGFDELQFDYIRFPSDGDMEQAIYPAWDRKTPRHEVLKSFFAFLQDTLKAYKPEIILSADIFGYVAAQREDLTIGQRLDDIGHFFDYVSFMVYPSHYYSGLYYPADPIHDLPAVNYTLSQARMHPDVVVGRSLIAARDYLDGKTGTTSIAGISASTTPDMVLARGRRARLRPWLEDFYHEDDQAAGRPYGAEKVRLQIDAAEDAEDAGWLLWNAANIYTEGALKKK